MPRKKTIISSSERASRQLPTIMKGRNLPIFVAVRSISPPQIGSVMPSKIRISGAKSELKVLMASTTPALATAPPRAAAVEPERYMMA